MGNDQIREALGCLIGYALSVRSNNTPEWMQGFADYINRAAVALDDPDRAEVEGDHLVIRRAQKQSGSVA